jgi:hypothetical protein
MRAHSLRLRPVLRYRPALRAFADRAPFRNEGFRLRERKFAAIPHRIDPSFCRGFREFETRRDRADLSSARFDRRGSRERAHSLFRCRSRLPDQMHTRNCDTLDCICVRYPRSLDNSLLSKSNSLSAATAAARSIAASDDHAGDSDTV